MMLDDIALSALGWWDEAGVDTIVDDVARDWLAPLPASRAAPETTGTPPPPAALPTTLEVFRAWLLTDPTVPGAAAARIDATGDAASGTMVVIDYPEPGDRREATLLGGEPGALFDRMLAAMQLARTSIYLAPLAPARPATGRLDAAACATLAALMRHHIALARPRRLLLLGDATVRALLDLPCAEARGRAHVITAAALAIPTIASFHPRALVQKIAAKADAWADLQSFMAL